MGLQDGSVSKNTYCQSNPNNLSSIPESHMAEGKVSNICTVEHKINI